MDADLTCMRESWFWPHSGDCSSIVCSTMIGSSLLTGEAWVLRVRKGLIIS